MPEDLDVLGEPRRRLPIPLRARLRRYAKISIVGTTIFLLMSMGGAIYGAPALVPGLWWAARSSGLWGRIGITFLASLVMTEVGWFVVYSTVGEEQPWAALGPALGFAGTIAAFALTVGPGPRRERPS